MELRFRETTRGCGKIFLRIEVEGVPADARFSATSVTDEGKALPARVIDAPAGVTGKVLVIPVSSRDQRVRVSAVSPAGDELASRSREVKASAAKRRSQLNTATRNAVAEKVRNWDRLVAPGVLEPTITPRRFVPEWGEGGVLDIVHVDVTFSSLDADALASPVELLAVDPDGNAVNVAPVTVLGDATAADRENPAALHRQLTFSFRMPHDQESLVMWARSASPAVGEGYVLLDPPALQGYRDSWYFFSISADRDPVYDEWFRLKHRTRPWELEAQRASGLPGGPRFSVVVPLYRTPVDLLREMADSFLAQTYDRFELVLVNSTPEDGELSREVARYAEADGRVKVVTLERNLGISGNTNEGVRAADGDFICFADHDDVVEPDILYRYAEAILAHPRCDLLYCDEDKLNEGRYEQVFFKPDWSPDYLRSVNYVCHMLCIRRAVLDEVGLERPDFDGAQDFELTLRATEAAREVFHVRKVLYHWRICPGSTSAGVENKSSAVDASVRAVQEHLDRLGIDAEAYVESLAPGSFLYHTRYRCPKNPPLVSVVIPNKDARDILAGCLESIREKTSYPNYEVVIVENNSTDPETFAYYDRVRREDPRVRVVTLPATDGAFNYSRLMNFGAAESRGDYILMLNNDTRVITEAWVEQLLGHAMEEGVGCVGAKLLYPDDTIQHGGVVFHKSPPTHLGIFLPRHSLDYFGALQTAHDYLAVTGACMMVSRAVFDEVGGFDESFAVDYNDVDFCLRVRAAGHRNVYEPGVELYHLESVSRGLNDTPEKALRFCVERSRLAERWPGYFTDGDPYQSPSIWAVNQYWHVDTYVTKV